ncbi:MAG: hypothetical protein HQK96_08510, partial [Nitrospirae bacterium]|nr:hypothetical protein [Nitrospirota bacterium]
VSITLPQQGREYVEALLVYCWGYYERKIKAGGDCQIGAIASKAFREGWQPQTSLFDVERKQKDQETKRKQEELKQQEEDAKEKEERIHQEAEDFIDYHLSDEEALEEFPLYLESKYNFFFKDRYRPDMKAEELKKGNLRLFLNHFVREKYFKPDSK